MPEPLLVYLGCDSDTEFLTSCVHCTFSSDYKDELVSKKYCRVTGQIVFRNAHLKTCLMNLVSEKILLEAGEMISVNRILDLQNL